VLSFFKAARDVYKRDTTKLNIIDDQKNNISEYVRSRFSRLYLRNNRQIELEIEWFSGTVFELSIGNTSGIVKINNIESRVSTVKTIGLCT